MNKFGIALPVEQIKSFCQKWKVKEFSLFGSVLRPDFNPESDVDVLVVFAENAGWDLWDIIEMRDELKTIFGREVDLVEKRALRNPFRKHEILQTHEIVYAS
ncbi:MAG: nucleotidyltransferase family protein [Proteobacteria bacterium]|nr:nucleotidyltransferase family protein [Pseudomonadota bacterium]